MQAIWQRALDDAGLGGADVDLRISPHPLDEELGARLVDGVVSIDIGTRPEVLVAALLRHELQHVCQLAVCPDLNDLHGLAQEVAAKIQPPELFGRIYNSIPMETDANAAGYRFVLRHYETAHVNAAAVAFPFDPVLRSNNASVRPDELSDSMISWFIEHLELCRLHARASAPTFADSVDVDELFGYTLDCCSPEAGSMWRTQVKDARGPQQHIGRSRG